MLEQEKNNQTPAVTHRQGVATILTQEQIAQMLSEDKLDYRSPEVFINDFLFVWDNQQQNYEKVLDVVFMNYFKARPFFTMYDLDEQQMHEAYYFFTMLCRNRELLVQIATDKGIFFNTKNQ
ncbi:hypothetical protein ACIRNY_02070 [Capnocytophaga canimorsus]|uniref:hypothetical protein n=1 Tax=Capnocytophaga canimorsus TaxID=28188 RepID=UPI00384EF81E